MSILVTGKNGSLAKDARSFFGENYQNEEILYLGREELDLTEKNDVDNFFESHNVKYILHTAIKGGRRTKKDSYEDLYDNLKMFHNLSLHAPKVKMFINFDSMASFDRRFPIDEIGEDLIFSRLPKDFYGLSKNIISRLGQHEHNNFLNLRIFSCFSENEPDDRMVKGNILKYLAGSPMIIHQNRYMDFTYSYDVLRVADYCMKNVDRLDKMSYNICYKEKTTLLEIAEMINNLSDNKVDIILQDKNMGPPITGCAKNIEKLNIPFVGLPAGVRKTYNLIRGER